MFEDYGNKEEFLGSRASPLSILFENQLAIELGGKCIV